MTFCFVGNLVVRNGMIFVIQQKFKWGTWEYDTFVQCGVKIEKNDTGGFDLSQAQYVDDIKEIGICSERRRTPKSPTTEAERRN